MLQHKRWHEIPFQQRIAMILLGIVQMTLLALALADIRRRPAEQIRGSKKVWTAVSFINFIGPISYLLFGRIA